MSDELREVILEIGAEGGSITLLGSREVNGSWKYFLRSHDSMLSDLRDDDEDELPPQEPDRGPVSTWREALDLLGTYTMWPEFYPLSLDPRFRGRVLAEVRRLGGQEEETRWVEFLRSREVRLRGDRRPRHRRRSAPRSISEVHPLSSTDFLAAIQSRIARVAVGASTVRGRGNKGSVAAARAQLREIDLRPFGEGPASFREALDIETERLMEALPESARSWGLARKLLNIFLRDCLYTTYLEEEYHLRQSEFAFEVPLDSITGQELDGLSGSPREDRWPGVKYLTCERSDRYQIAAEKEAANWGVARVHLDSVWWSLDRDDDD